MTVRPSRSGPPAWVPYAGLTVSVSVMIFQAGVLSNRVEAVEARVSKVEIENGLIREKLNGMDIRGAQNAEKLNLLVDYARKGHP